MVLAIPAQPDAVGQREGDDGVAGMRRPAIMQFGGTTRCTGQLSMEVQTMSAEALHQDQLFLQGQD